MFNWAKSQNCDMPVYSSFQNYCGNQEVSEFSEYQSSGIFTNEQSPVLYDCDANTRVCEWLGGCEVVGFIPDQSFQTDAILKQEFFAEQNVGPYTSDYNYRNQVYRNSYQNISNSGKLTNTFKTKLKHKRKRTIFTTKQIVALEGMFQKKPYISREERAAMMKILQVSEKAIKVWFQNRRRVTDKKYQEFISDSPSSEDSSETISDRLSFIESQIIDNTDEYGYVTLNENVIDQLARIIDEYLPQDIDTCTNETYSDKIEDKVIYEPISPASMTETSDMEDNTIKLQDYWQGFTNFV